MLILIFTGTVLHLSNQVFVNYRKFYGMILLNICKYKNLKINDFKKILRKIQRESDWDGLLKITV